MPRPLFTFPLLAGALALAAPTSLIANESTPAPQSLEFAQFTPADADGTTRLDWKSWDQALNYFVLNMGPSTRQLATQVQPALGSRFVYGHNSRYRLEGNKIAFDILEDNQIQALTEYRQDLERIGSEIDLSSLPRNEQLAFWINLHNVAVIEQLALNYPSMSPRKVEPAGFAVPLDEAKFITVAGVAMSPKDIRTKIVYPNWDDPKVIYGFFHGEIGGPSIPRKAFTGENVGPMLADNAREFVNALRGVDKSGSTMKVSTLYEEARAYYFTDWEADLRAHIATYAEDDVQAILASTSAIEASISETDIADLSKGERQPLNSNTEQCVRAPTGEQSCNLPDPRVNPAVQRFVQERSVKIQQLIEDGRIGTVLVREVDEEEAGEVE